MAFPEPDRAPLDPALGFSGWLWAVFFFSLLSSGCNDNARGAHAPDATTSPGQGGEPEWFADQAKETGLEFVHVNGMTGKFYLPEIISPGVALFDYDNDGDLDVYFVQGQSLEIGKMPILASDTLPPRDRLYRNDLQVHPDGTRTLHFTDVTEQSGIDARGYGVGVATGDFDNDGWVDLYLTRVGPNQMFHNRGDGTFSEVSKQSGTADAGWGVSASFFDYDRDGWLDLFLGNYLSWSIETNTQCFSASGSLDYCAPQVYRAQPSRLFHNNRDGTFADVTARAGMASEFGPALGAVSADFNADGWPDLYVANDGQENQLWINQRNGSFKNLGLLSGAAMSGLGKPKAGMGVDAGDVDNDGDEDLVVTNLTNEGSDLYVNDGSGMFEEQSARSGLGLASLAYTGFGTAWFDFDNDGRLDLLTVNGMTQFSGSLARPGDRSEPHQRKQLFHNLGSGRFEDVTDRAGAVFRLSELGRGAAFGDVDNDGDVDVVVANNGGRAQLLVNNIGNRNQWVGLRVVGKQTPRDMLGARIGIIREDGSSLWRRARADASYASANDPRVLVGLGRAGQPFKVRVVWPSDHVEEWTEVPINGYTTLTERDSGRGPTVH